LAGRRNSVATIKILPVLKLHLDLLQVVDCLIRARTVADCELYLNLECTVFSAKLD